MKHPPAFQFYPSDWLADIRIASISAAGEGVYIRLLCYAWREGGIPADRVAIARLCKGEDKAIDEALQFFVPDTKNSGFLVNKRQEEDRKRQLEHRKHQISSGLRGAKKRWQAHGKPNGNPIDSPMAKNSSSSSSSSSSSIITPIVPMGDFFVEASSKRNFAEDARSLIAFLNASAGRSYQADGAHLELLVQRLKQTGIEVVEVQKMILRQVKLWKGTEMEKYLRPQTLFNKTKFAGYYDERDLPTKIDLVKPKEDTLRAKWHDDGDTIEIPDCFK